MADKQSRLAEIYKSEKAKGGGLISTLAKRNKEKYDPRQIFNQKGFAAALLPTFFKAYNATPDVTPGKKISRLSSDISSSRESKAAGFSSAILESKVDVLIKETKELTVHSKIAAKNSIVLPAMARDMNVTRQNIVKLVKLQGGTATTKADMFFKRAGDREAAYESKFNKNGGVKATTPTKVDENKEGSKTGIFGMLGGIFSLITGAIGTIVKTAVSSVGGILSSVGGVLTLLVSGLGLIVSSIGSIGKGLLSTISFLSKIPIIGKFFKVAALIGAGVGLYNILKPNKEGEENTESGDTNSGPGGIEGIAEKGKDLVNQGKEAFGEYGGAAAGGVAAVGAARVASKVMGAEGLAAKTGTAVLDARTMSVGQLAKSTPTSRWGKFLSFVAKKSPTLFGRLSVKLAQAGALMAVPFAGWVGAAIELGFTFWTAWELYELWREFNNSKEDEGEQDKSPTMSTTPIVEGAGGAAFGMYSKPGMEPQKDSSGSSTNAAGMKGYKSRAGIGREGSPTQATSQTPENAAPINVKKLTKEQSAIASLIYDKFTQAGFNDAQATAAVVNAYAESSLNPKAKNESGKEASYGLFQMNTKGGLGAGHDPEKLKDPNYNIDLAIQAAKKSKGFMAATTVDGAISAFTKEIERPANADAEAMKRIALASSLTGVQPGNATGSPTMTASAPNTGGLGTPNAQKVDADKKPDFGSMIASATSELGDTLSTFNNAMHSITNVTNNNTQAAAPQPASRGNLPSVYDDIFLNLFQRVT
jgi:hypothetical protein